MTEQTTMTEEAALSIIADAADKWAGEIMDYIVDGATTDEERQSWVNQADDIARALDFLADRLV